MDQRPRPAWTWPRLRLVDTARGGRSDRAEVQYSAWRVCGGRIARQVGTDAAERPLQRAYQRDPEAIEAWRRERFPGIARQAKASGGEVYFWDKSGFRADAVHGKTWGKKGQTPVVERPGQRQSISAASAVNARGGFWYCTYQGGLNAEAFVSLLQRMMRRRSKPVHLVLDGLPAHKTTLVKTYVASTKGMLTLR